MPFLKLYFVTSKHKQSAFVVNLVQLLVLSPLLLLLKHIVQVRMVPTHTLKRTKLSLALSFLLSRSHSLVCFLHVCHALVWLGRDRRLPGCRSPVPPSSRRQLANITKQKTSSRTPCTLADLRQPEKKNPPRFFVKKMRLKGRRAGGQGRARAGRCLPSSLAQILRTHSRAFEQLT